MDSRGMENCHTMRCSLTLALFLAATVYLAGPRAATAHEVDSARAALYKFLDGELGGAPDLRMEMAMFTTSTSSPDEHVVDIDVSEFIVVSDFEIESVRFVGDDLLSVRVQFTKVARTLGQGVAHRQIISEKRVQCQDYTMGFFGGNWKVVDPPVPGIHPKAVERFLLERISLVESIASRKALSSSQEGYLKHLRNNLAELRNAAGR